MMLYPPVSELVNKTGSRYQLVNLVAREARKIAADAEEKQIPLEKKPVSAAIDEVYTGKLTIK
jgi:DNA-directed RNA polymerase omega subunit